MNWLAVCAEHIGGREEQQDSVGVFHSADGAACLLLVVDTEGNVSLQPTAQATCPEFRTVDFDRS